MTATEQSETEKTGSAAPSRPGPLGFFLRAAALVLAALVSVFTFVVITPDDTTYALASNLKHDALARRDPKIVLVGGSNLSYGIDSALIARSTHCPVVNMGMNGFFGIQFMLEEVKPQLHSGDVVVIAFEHESYARPVEGASIDLLMVTKANPETLSALTPQQILGIASQYPYVAHQKILRLIGDAARLLGHAFGLANLEEIPPYDMRRIETLSGFNADGDLTSHLGLRWPYPPAEENNLPEFALEPEVVPLLENFVREMSERDVRVLISYSSIERSFYEKHRAAIDGWDATFRSSPLLTVPSPPSRYVFDPSMHFDTVYHLNERGRAARSQMLADDIVGAFDGAPPCSTQTPAQESTPQ